MKRFTISFLVLAGTGCCITVESDPNDYGAPRRTSAPPPWMTNGQAGLRGADGKPIQTSSEDPSQRSNTTSTNSSASGAKTSTPQNASTNNVEVKQAAYTAAKTKSESEKTSTADSPAKSSAVNLGLLRLVNSKRITFHYKVKDPTSASVAGLELWGTTDMRNWKKYDTVARTPGSLVIDVKDEGLYGFTMVAHGKGEPATNQPPQSGETPQVWVAIDVTKPVVQLRGAEWNGVSQTPSLVVRWTAKDRNLGPRPITLLYAERLEGPWSPLAANLENSGRHEWVIPAYVPSSVYVRVQATDLMGNVGMAQTTLHIPCRTAAPREATPAEPPRLSALPSSPALEMIRPVAAAAPNPAVSILSVESVK